MVKLTCTVDSFHDFFLILRRVELRHLLLTKCLSPKVAYDDARLIPAGFATDTFKNIKIACRKLSYKSLQRMTKVPIYAFAFRMQQSPNFLASWLICGTFLS